MKRDKQLDRIDRIEAALTQLEQERRQRDDGCPECLPLRAEVDAAGKPLKLSECPWFRDMPIAEKIRRLTKGGPDWSKPPRCVCKPAGVKVVEDMTLDDLAQCTSVLNAASSAKRISVAEAGGRATIRKVSVELLFGLWRCA